MSDKLLDKTQLINGIAVLLSFYVGYKYALQKKRGNKEPAKKGVEAQSTECDAAAGDQPVQQLFTNICSTSWSNNYKMVLVVRNDLKMGKGKIAAQCGHGAVGAYQQAVTRSPLLVRSWENTGCAKIALKVESERELMAIKRAAEANNLNTCLIRDAGRTQIEPNSKTVLAIGPAGVEDIDRVTGHLKLL